MSSTDNSADKRLHKRLTLLTIFRDSPVNHPKSLEPSLEGAHFEAFKLTFLGHQRAFGDDEEDAQFSDSVNLSSTTCLPVFGVKAFGWKVGSFHYSNESGDRIGGLLICHLNVSLSRVYKTRDKMMFMTLCRIKRQMGNYVMKMARQV